MRIVEVAMEFAPMAKVGGLGEVVTGLSRELTRLGHDVAVIVPKYDFITQELALEVPEFVSFENGNEFSNAMWATEAEGCHLHLLEAHHPANYFGRGKIYGCEDDVARFLYFSRAVVEYLKLQGEPIDVVHLHDWHVAAVAPMLKDLSELHVKRIVLTIHNAEYQGHCSVQDLDAVGLLDKDSMQDNLLKGGIVYADAVVAVSPTYAQEILTPFAGFGLDPTFRKYKSKLSGILNGIDLELWNPGKDPHLATKYTARNVLAAKRKNQQALEERFGLQGQGKPWVGAVTRLVPQKGPGLIEEALQQAVQAGAVFALLGTSPMPAIQQRFEHLRDKYRGNKQVLIHLEYDEALAHQLFASLDFHLVPSLFEPCGLTQMIALHYGTLPIVRATGGLKDTVNQDNGFVFQEPTHVALADALRRALQFWQEEPSRYQSMIQHGMKFDFGWKTPAQQYLKVFQGPS